jgi:hypothetical protein
VYVPVWIWNSRMLSGGRLITYVLNAGSVLVVPSSR